MELADVLFFAGLVASAVAIAINALALLRHRGNWLWVRGGAILIAINYFIVWWLSLVDVLPHDPVRVYLLLPAAVSSLALIAAITYIEH